MNLKEEYWTEEEMAEMLGKKKSTMQTQRSRGKGHPPFIRIGRKIYFSKADFKRWVRDRPVKEEILK